MTANSLKSNVKMFVFFVSDKAQEIEFGPSLYKTPTSRSWPGKKALKKLANWIFVVVREEHNAVYFI